MLTTGCLQARVRGMCVRESKRKSSSPLIRLGAGLQRKKGVPHPPGLTPCGCAWEGYTCPSVDSKNSRHLNLLEVYITRRDQIWPSTQ